MNRNTWRWWVARPLVSFIFSVVGGAIALLYLFSGAVHQATENYHEGISSTFLGLIPFSPLNNLLVVLGLSFLAGLMVTYSILNLVVFGRIFINPMLFADRLGTRKDSFQPWFRMYEHEDWGPTDRFFEFFAHTIEGKSRRRNNAGTVSATD